jgi:hypothetical protein
MKSTSPTPFIIAFLIAAAGIYWYVSTNTGNQIPLSASGSENQAQTQFQSLVGELSSISFKTTLFSDPHLTVLVDLTTPIAPEPIGRLDPFAVVESVSGN